MTEEKIVLRKVKMLKQTFFGSDQEQCPAQTYYVGEVYSVPEIVATRWIQRKIATVSVKSVPMEDPTEPIEVEGTRVPRFRDLIKDN